jgi:hypothetical protein
MVDDETYRDRPDQQLIGEPVGEYLAPCPIALAADAELPIAIGKSSASP